MFELLLNNFFLWANILIVVIFTLYQLINNKQISLKEFFIQIVVTIVSLSIIMFLIIKFGMNISQKEILNTTVDKFVYEEPWTEEYDCSEEVCSTDSSGNKSCHTVTKTCYTRHDSLFYIVDTDRDHINISRSAYKNAVKDFGSYEKKMNRYSQEFYSKQKGEGDIWYSIPDIVIPVAKYHRYLNYILGSEETIQKYKGEKKYNVLPYPKIHNGRYGTIEVNRVIGYSNFELEKQMDLLNADLGKIKQINAFLYVTDKPRDFKDSLVIAWKGGNKNDSILILGVDKKGNVIWSDSINWSDNEKYGIMLEKSFNGLNINDNKIVNTYKDIILKYWKRLSMEEKYGYLKTEIEIPWYYQVLIILFNLTLNFFLYRYFLKNNI